MFRKFTFLKSFKSKKYLCFNYNTHKFMMKSLGEIDKYCVFNLSIKSINEFIFTIGSTNSIDLSFNKFGILNNSKITSKTKFKQKCQNSNIFSVHTKLTDLVDQYSQILSYSHTEN
jgi:hypothetical protein